MIYDEDFGFVCICAVRYALGRRTYASSIVTKYVLDNLDCLEENDIKVIIRDVCEAKDYGDENIDKPIWLSFVDGLKEYLGENG